MSDLSIHDSEWDFDESGAPYHARAMLLGPRAGAQQLGATLYELDPGGAISPHHSHEANEEMLVVLEGTPALRTPQGIRDLEQGAVVSFPCGPDGAHRISNRSDAPARVLFVSTMRYPEIVEHLDTGATLAMSGPAAGKVFPAGVDVDVMSAVMSAMELGAERERE